MTPHEIISSDIYKTEQWSTCTRSRCRHSWLPRSHHLWFCCTPLDLWELIDNTRFFAHFPLLLIYPSVLLNVPMGNKFVRVFIMEPSPTIVHTRLGYLHLINRLFVSFLLLLFQSSFFYLVLFFIKRLYNEVLNFSFCKYISFHPTSICSKPELLKGAILFTFSISLNKFLLVEIPGTKHLTQLVIEDIYTCVYVLDIYIYICIIHVCVYIYIYIYIFMFIYI